MRSAPPTGAPNGRSTGSLERDDWAALAYQGQVTTGATALLIAGLTIRREATGDTRYDDVLRRLGRFVLAQTEPSGAVLASYDPARRAPGGRRVLQVLHRARPTGRWRACTGPSRTRAGARPRTASAPTWRRRGTRSRTTGRRSPITGRPTACPRPCEFPERGRPPLTEDEVALRAPAGRAVRRPGPLARASIFGPWGASGAGQLRAPWRLVRRDRRGAHRVVADRAGGAAARRPASADRGARHLHRRAWP